jgi:hypothetical protein
MKLTSANEADFRAALIRNQRTKVAFKAVNALTVQTPTTLHQDATQI